MHRIATLALVGVIGMMEGAASPVSGQSAATSIRVAAASDLQALLPELIARFERDTGATVALSFGSSGNFFAQIRNGAPFDVFFSADADYPARLVADRLADADSLYHYAAGRIVLWTRHGSGLDLRRGLEVLRDGRVRRIAIANPEHAPYGRAAVAALRHDKVYDAVRQKLVLGENISQAAQLVDSGNADVGIIALSLALGPTLRASGAYAEIPAAAHPPIRQAAVIVAASRRKALARQLLAYVHRPESQELLRRFGFTPGAAGR